MPKSIAVWCGGGSRSTAAATSYSGNEMFLNDILFYISQKDLFFSYCATLLQKMLKSDDDRKRGQLLSFFQNGRLHAYSMRILIKNTFS